MARQINCADCGHPAIVYRSNGKYCTVCRHRRNMIFVRNRTEKCWACESKFAPLHRNDVLCGQCDASGTKHSIDGSCVFCGAANRRLLSGDIAICISCAKDPELRRRVVVAINKKFARRLGETIEPIKEHDVEPAPAREAEVPAV